MRRLHEIPSDTNKEIKKAPLERGLVALIGKVAYTDDDYGGKVITSDYKERKECQNENNKE